MQIEKLDGQSGYLLIRPEDEIIESFDTILHTINLKEVKT